MGKKNTVAYERHEPTTTPLHRMVATHLETFVANAEERAGGPLPRYVVEELRAFCARE